MDPRKEILGIGEYRKEDYPEILLISDDRDILDQTWEEWKNRKKEVVKQLRNSYTTIVDVVVYPKELEKYYKENGLLINRSSRAEFVTDTLRKQST